MAAAASAVDRDRFMVVVVMPPCSGARGGLNIPAARRVACAGGKADLALRTAPLPSGEVHLALGCGGCAQQGGGARTTGARCWRRGLPVLSRAQLGQRD